VEQFKKESCVRTVSKTYYNSH